MDDEDDDAVFEEKPCASKLSRKVGEKLRRDRLNSLITELAEEIPIIKYAHRRLDKSTILRLTVSFMKLHLGLKRKRLGGGVNLHGAGLLNWLQKVTDDVLLIMSQSGTIIYVSPKVIDLLGFYQTDMVGYHIDRFVHPDDLEVLMSQFLPNTEVTSKTGFRNCSQNNPMPSDGDQLNTECRSFCIRMLKALKGKHATSETKEYETVCVRANCENKLDVESSKAPVDEQWMLAMLKPFSSEPIREVDIKMSEFLKNNEWATMHDLNSRIIANDQRSSLFHGFLPSEIIGKTPYVLIYEDDLESVAVSHQMIMKNHQIPSTVFRMNNRSDLTLYIQSESIIVKDQWTKQPKNIVSVNRVLSLEEGRYLLDLQKKITKKYLESEKADTEPVVNVEEVESDDSADSRKEPSVKQSSCSLVQITNTDGKSLKEAYDKESQNFQKFYVPDKACSYDRNMFDSEKRSHDCIDSDSSGVESSSSSTMLSDTSNTSVTEEEVYSPPKYRSPSLKDLLSDDKCLKQTRADTWVSEKSVGSEPLPLLKGILQGNVKMNEKLQPLPKQRISEKGLSRPSRKDCSRNVTRSLESSQENGASCEASVSPPNEVPDCHAAGSHCVGVQSPTVDSSEIVSVASSAQSSVEMKNVTSGVYSRFTSQLSKKHSMLKQTIDSQKTTLEVLKDQLQKSHNNVVLSSQQKKVHDSLIEKLTEAEDQVVVQCELLKELEEEILDQQI